MGQLTERAFVACPYHRAREYLAAGVGERINSGEAMTLRVPLAGIELKKDVVVTFSPGIDPMHMDQPWRVHWTPEGGGPYPDFDGELTVRADEDYTSSVLELVGDYRPPGGALGQAFDAVVGSHIATLTARNLLKRLGDEFEARYGTEEEQKRHEKG
ncbi:MAG TPA: hypothetical protein VMV82_04940 [Candidatus Dormibacteraeota bacterium]|nr:hypothetical protein [Candidatus Dormibacteraeota bacterium]